MLKQKSIHRIIFGNWNVSYVFPSDFPILWSVKICHTYRFIYCDHLFLNTFDVMHYELNYGVALNIHIYENPMKRREFLNRPYGHINKLLTNIECGHFVNCFRNLVPMLRSKHLLKDTVLNLTCSAKWMSMAMLQYLYTDTLK